jgi:hypothetical protein
MEGTKVRARAPGCFAVFVLAVLAFSSEPVRGQAQETRRYDPAKAARANNLLDQARIAAGGKEELQRVTSLTVSMRARRFVRYISIVSPVSVVQKEKTLKGSLSIELQLPDKFRKRVSSTTLLGRSYSYVEIVNGDRAWREPPLQAPSSNRDPRLIDVNDFERSLVYQAQGARGQLSFYALALLIRAVPGDPLKFNYEGWMKTDSGTADVLSASGPTDSGTLVMLDQKTHLPMEYDSSYSGVRSLPVVIEGLTFNRRDYNRMLQRAVQERKAQTATPRTLIIQRRVSDYRQVSGILFPHRLVTLIDERPVEELVITKITVNRRLIPKEFEPDPRYKGNGR